VLPKKGTTVSKYVRGAVLMSMVMDGKAEAIKIVAREVGEKAFAVVRQKLFDRHRKDAEEECYPSHHQQAKPVRAACRQAAGRSGMAPVLVTRGRYPQRSVQEVDRFHGFWLHPLH
jgi:hypothetical protein